MSFVIRLQNCDWSLWAILAFSHMLFSLSRLRPCTVVLCPGCSLIFFVYSARPPSLFSPLHLSLCIIFLLMLPCCCCCVLGGRETNIVCTRCLRCSNLGHWARATLWTSQGNVYRGTGFAPGYSFSFQKEGRGAQVQHGAKQ